MHGALCGQRNANTFLEMSVVVYKEHKEWDRHTKGLLTLLCIWTRHKTHLSPLREVNSKMFKTA